MLTSKGQVTIPKQMRERLGLTEGDRLVFRIDAEGKMVVERQTEAPLGRLAGLLRHLARRRPVTVPEMRAAVRRRARRKRACLRRR